MAANAIQSLLKYNNRVNIPTLGAIIKQQDFSQSIFFNQFIRYDDGVLLDHLIRVESLAPDEAHRVIDGFINLVSITVAREGKISIEGLGIFCRIDNRQGLGNLKADVGKTFPVLKASTKRRASDG